MNPHHQRTQGGVNGAKVEEAPPTAAEDGATPDAAAPATPPPSGELPAVLTVDEAAAFLRVNRKTLYAAITKGDFPARRVGSSLRISREAMHEWLRQDRVPRKSRSNKR